MNLHETLTDIAAYLKLDTDELKTYAAEDAVGGWDRDTGGWPVGSLWSVEGKVLYALVRALKPAQVLELGTFFGCSATHFLMALDANGVGELTCVDNLTDARSPQQIGALIPPYLRDQATFHFFDLAEFVQAAVQAGTRYDFIFEDGRHDPEQIAIVWECAQQLLHPGGVILSHDAEHFLVGAQVKAGIRAGGVSDFRSYLIEPSDCGLAIWMKPVTAEDLEAIQAEYHAEWKQAHENQWVAPSSDSSLSALTVAQLHDIARARGLSVPAKARKQELIDLLTQAGGDETGD